MRTKRQINYELLRVLAMLMIVALHYLGKGGALGDPKEELRATGYAAWLIESFCLVSVNVYVLISGYFGVEASGFHIRKPLRIYGQVWFYSVSIGLLAFAVGHSQFDIYQCMTYVFPCVTEHYWFATAYLVLCLMMPFLNAGAKGLDRRSFEWILGGLLLFFCIAKSVLPMQLPWDHKGYDAFWFVFLYLTGAYLRKYPITGGMKWIVAYIVNALLTYGSFLAIRSVYLHTGKLGDFISYAYSYNHIFTYIGAIGLFLGFAKVGSGWGEKAGNIITTLAGATFGVYLIHEHIQLRYTWEGWFDCEGYAQYHIGVFLAHMVMTVCAVYLACTAIELCRRKAAEVLLNSAKGR